MSYAIKFATNVRLYKSIHLRSHWISFRRFNVILPLLFSLPTVIFNIVANSPPFLTIGPLQILLLLFVTSKIVLLYLLQHISLLTSFTHLIPSTRLQIHISRASIKPLFLFLILHVSYPHNDWNYFFCTNKAFVSHVFMQFYSKKLNLFTYKHQYCFLLYNLSSYVISSYLSRCICCRSNCISIHESIQISNKTLSIRFECIVILLYDSPLILTN